MMSTATVQRFSTGVIPAQAGTQGQASLMLGATDAFPLGSRLRGNDGGGCGDVQ
jgi:hypothetical protein